MKRWMALSLLPVAGLLGACLAPTDVRPAWPFGGGDVAPENWQQDGRYRDGQQAAQEAPAPAEAPSDPAPLLSWDGGVVDGPASGAVNPEPDPRHGLEPTLEGRMHIIELYQQVLDERDALLGEVEALTAALERAQTLLQTTQDGVASLEARIAALEEGHRLLLEENQDIAGRLTTAQIRRLEAEKLLLESRIAWHKNRLQESSAAVERTSGAGGKQ